MKEEFNLSEKIGEVADYNIEDVGNIHKAVAQKVFEFEDVKEFIRLLKEDLQKVESVRLIDNNDFISIPIIVWEKFKQEIDKLAGDKLKWK